MLLFADAFRMGDAALLTCRLLLVCNIDMPRAVPRTLLTVFITLCTHRQYDLLLFRVLPRAAGCRGAACGCSPLLL